MGVIIAIGHRMESGENEVGELHCDLVRVIPFARVHIRTILVGGHDTYNLDINVSEIELIRNRIL